MDVAIVYESVFGNTREVAKAIADGVREADPQDHVSVLSVAEATPDKIRDVELLIVGGPTHMLGMTKASSRKKAAEMPLPATHAPREPGSIGPGIRDWLDALPDTERAGGAGHENKAAAFDTRLSYPLAGGAARAIARRLSHHGYTLAIRPRGFIVDGAQGPTRKGECDRAKAWGTKVRQAVR